MLIIKAFSPDDRTLPGWTEPRNRLLTVIHHMWHELTGQGCRESLQSRAALTTMWNATERQWWVLSHMCTSAMLWQSLIYRPDRGGSQWERWRLTQVRSRCSPHGLLLFMCVSNISLPWQDNNLIQNNSILPGTAILSLCNSLVIK